MITDQQFINWLANAQLTRIGKAEGPLLTAGDDWVPWSAEAGDVAVAKDLVERKLIECERIPSDERLTLRLETNNDQLLYMSRLTETGWEAAEPDLKRRWAMRMLGASATSEP